jgi:FMN phosphatase YigB (HAD superfamily)
MADRVVFLFDVDNTLLNNDRVIADLQRHIASAFGEAMMNEYWTIFEELRENVGYADYLGALQRFRTRHPRDPHVLEMSSFLVDYPFANRIYPGALDAVEAVSTWGAAVILSDGDVVFQPRKVERSGLADAVGGRVLIYVHKEEMLEDVAARFPAEHYVMVDDKLRLLAAMKAVWGSRLTTVFVQQGHYAADPAILAKYAPATLAIERIDQLLDYDFGEGWTPGHLPPQRTAETTNPWRSTTK